MILPQQNTQTVKYKVFNTLFPENPQNGDIPNTMKSKNLYFQERADQTKILF